MTAKPHWIDTCGHTRPRDCFLGTITFRGVPHDVYVYQDNALDAPKPDMHICVRYGEKGHQYFGPGNVDDFLKVCTTEQWRFISGKAPEEYLQIKPLIEKWIAEGRPSQK